MATTAKKGGAKRPSRAKNASKTAAKTATARPGETEADARARTSGETAGTQLPPLEGAQARTGNTPLGDHNATGNPADSTVRHAEPQTGKQQGEGEGGHPQGEYDVTQAAPAGAVPLAAQKDAALEAHFAQATVGLPGGDLDAILKDALADSTLDESEILKVTEALPVGIVIEHEGPNRWRCHRTGQGRYGHGRTFLEAVESYVIGLSAPNATDAAARAFVKLPAAQRKEILDRDAAAAASVGGTDPMATVRAEALKTAQKQAGAVGDPGAASDGAAKASATSAGAKRAAAAKRTGGSKRSSRSRSRSR